MTPAVTRDAVNNVNGLSVLPVDDVETNEELALQIAVDPTLETTKEFDEKRALQKAKLLSRLRNESGVDLGNDVVSASTNGFTTKLEGMREDDDRQDDVFIVELMKGDDGIGLGLIDGLVSFQYSGLCCLLAFFGFNKSCKIALNCLYCFSLLQGYTQSPAICAQKWSTNSL